MKRVEISILSWGIYLIVLGLALISFPVKTVALFGYDGYGDLWIRLTGILSAVLGMYYIQIAKNRIYQLYKWKIVGHIFGLFCMVAFIVEGSADQRMIGTITVESLACLWTIIALRLNSKHNYKTSS
jgi:hypothetical protein